MDNFFNLFGISESDIKDTKKKNKQKSTKQSSKQLKRYSLPVHIQSGEINFCMTKMLFPEKDAIDEKLIEEEITKRYPELSNVEFNIIAFDNIGTNIIQQKENMERMLEQTKEESLEESLENSESLAGGSWVKLELLFHPVSKTDKLTFPLTIKIGSESMLIEEEIEIEELQQVWSLEHPEYTGCKFHYDTECQFLIPYMSADVDIKGIKITLPVTVGFRDIKRKYESKDFKEEQNTTWKEIRELYAKEFPEYENGDYVYLAEHNLIYPIIAFKSTTKETKVSLPVTVRGSGFTLEFDETDLNKKLVTVEEIRKKLEEIFPEFSKERTEMIYDERGFVVPILKGSRKGIRFLNGKKNENLYFVQGRDQVQYRIEQKPFGQFYCRTDGAEVNFYLSLKKIPQVILKSIVTYFLKTPEKESAVQIFYDMHSKGYQIYYPKQVCDSSNVVFERNHDLESRKTLVMDVHSHGMHPAFFSWVDNRDEKGTRLYLVVGNMNKDKQSFMLRAGIAGYFRSLELNDIFEMEEQNWKR